MFSKPQYLCRQLRFTVKIGNQSMLDALCFSFTKNDLSSSGDEHLCSGY
jgi:hypothetical protein